ncbi:MAG: hypothetical protein CL908_08565 [Deltaproteobacteria bacterium]|nr:hypothetical protein [Deltaproteobacteria bacterium]
MNPDHRLEQTATAQDSGLISRRFLTEFLGVLRRQGLPVTDLLGDLPIPIGERGEITGPTEWPRFVDFMQRLERHLGGPEGLERCGELIGSLQPASLLRGIAGITASPYVLYRTVSQWALPRAIPGLTALAKRMGNNQIEIHLKLASHLRPCPQFFHFVTGANRAIPRVLGSPEAVVSADIDEREACFQITVPHSRTLAARTRRLARALFSSNALLQFMESQQLELHAKHATLRHTHAALAESERRYRAITDTAADVLCELDDQGRIVYVSASVQDLMGYSPEQVTGSHLRLWIPSRFHERANQSFSAIVSKPPGHSISLELVTLHAAHGKQIVAEISVRSYRTSEGSWRMVGILRDVTHHFESRPIHARGSRASRNGVNANAVEGLRAALGRVRDEEPAHALEGSLSRLLEALAPRPAAWEAIDVEQMVEATRRMTQIVQSAMAQTPDPTSKPQWIDSEELAEFVRKDFEASRCRGASPDLRIDLSLAPSQIWRDGTLLEAVLGSLLDWAVAVGNLAAQGDDSAPPPIGLAVESIRRPRGQEDAVAFLISPGCGLPESSDPLDASQANRGDLAMAIASDAVATLSADLTLECEPGQPLVARVLLPQPDSAL